MKADEKLTNYLYSERVMAGMIALRDTQSVLSGFALHLASHFGRSFKNHSYGYACLNDRPNCLASYSAKSGSFMQYAGWLAIRNDME